MNKAELITKVSEKANVTQKVAKVIVDTLFDGMKEIGSEIVLYEEVLSIASDTLLQSPEYAGFIRYFWLFKPETPVSDSLYKVYEAYGLATNKTVKLFAYNVCVL